MRPNICKHLLLFSLIFLIFDQTTGHDRKERASKPRGYGSFHFSSGIHFDDVPNFNKTMKAAGLPTTSGGIGSIGVGGYRAFKHNWLLGAEIHYGFNTSGNDTHGMLTHRAGHLLYFGYNVFQTRIVKLYPVVGWTGSIMVVTMYEKDDSEVDFSTFTSNPRNAGTLFNRGGAIHLGIGADFKIRNTERSTVFGIRMGFELATTQNWDAWGGAKLVNGPKDEIGGFYMKINVGFINHDTFVRKKRIQKKQEVPSEGP